MNTHVVTEKALPQGKKRSVYLLVLPGVHLMDLAAPAQILGHLWLEEHLQLHYISTDARIQSHQGLAFSELEPLPEQVNEDSRLFLIGTFRAALHLEQPYYLQARDWLARVADQFELIGGICSGSLLAAYAGLLKGKACTSHHELLDELKRLAPDARVQEDCIFVRDDKFWTSAGITTGIDLCLQLTADCYGHDLATRIARDMVVFQRRSGQEPQLSFWLQHRNHIHSRIHSVQDAVMARPGHPWRIAELADIVHISDRQLRRLFKDATGYSLQDWIQLARLELSRQLLLQTRFPVEEVASRCGFESERSLRRLWQRWQGVSPGQFRIQNFQE